MWIEIKLIKGRHYRYECHRENGKKHVRYIGAERSTREGRPSAPPLVTSPTLVTNPTAHPTRSAVLVAPTVVSIGASTILIHGEDAADVAQFIFMRCKGG